MKYNLIICQKEIIERGYNLDFVDSGILTAIVSLTNSNFVQDIKESDGKYFWISPNLLLKEIPLILRTRTKNGFKNFTKDSIKRRILHLCNTGFFIKHKNNQSMGRLYLKVTSKTNEIFRSPDSTYVDVPPTSLKTYPTSLKTYPTSLKTYPLPLQRRTPTSLETYNNNTNNNNTNNNIVKEVKTSKSIPFENEFLEIFKILKEHSGNDFRINLNRLQNSNKYKDFVRFFKTYKSEYTFEEVKEVVKYTAVKNLGTDSQKYTNFSTLFRAKNFERNFDFWLTSKNKDSKPLNNPAHTNTPIQQIKLTGLNLDRFKHLYSQLNDTRFTESTFLNVFGGKKYDAVRNRKTPREIVRAIQAGLNSLSQAFNKNRSLTELIIEKL